MKNNGLHSGVLNRHKVKSRLIFIQLALYFLIEVIIMDGINQLQWCERDDGVHYTKPTGQRWSYIIYPLQEKKGVELVLIDNDEIDKENVISPHTTIERAKKAAHVHYIQICNAFFDKTICQLI